MNTMSRINNKNTILPPSLEEWLSYIKTNNLNIKNSESLYYGYSDGGWIDTRGNKVKNWKLKLRTLDNFSGPKTVEACRESYLPGQSPRELALKAKGKATDELVDFFSK